jgi:hypothetical protein
LRQRLLTTAAACLLLAGVGASVRAFADGSAAPSRPAPPAANAGPPSDVPTNEANMLSALRNPPATTVPPMVRQFAHDPTAVTRYAPNADLARTVVPENGQSNRPWYLLPGENSVCLFAGEAGTCASIAQVASGKLILFAVPAPPPVPVVNGHADLTAGANAASNPTGDSHVRMMGVAPDGVVAVTVDSAAGKVSAPVVDNVYELDADAIANLTFQHSDGSSTLVNPAA